MIKTSVETILKGKEDSVTLSMTENGLPEKEDAPMLIDDARKIKAGVE